MFKIVKKKRDRRPKCLQEAIPAPADITPRYDVTSCEPVGSTSRCAFHSTEGRRPTNQDRAVALEVRLPVRKYALAAVADGMGGYAGGERAAELAIEELLKALAASLAMGLHGRPFQPERAIRHAFLAANRAIQQDALLHPERQDMGTTLTLGLTHGDELFVASVGDSRLYLWQSRDFKLMTLDDSVVQRMVNLGDLTESKARSHPLDNQILHALGVGETLETLRITRHRLLPGDLVVVASDGFWKSAEFPTPSAIPAFERATGPGALEHLAVSLVDEAYRAGSDDNITVALLWHNAGSSENRNQDENHGGCDHGR